MSAKIIFCRRTVEEINLYGGQVFADIDDKNVATIEKDYITIDVTPGTHKIKMYKSHEYGSMIGFAEANITIEEGETLVLRYTPPMVVSNAGHIKITHFISYEACEKELQHSSQIIQNQCAKDKEVEKETQSNAAIWFILLFIIPSICWLIYYLVTVNSTMDIYNSTMDALNSIY